MHHVGRLESGFYLPQIITPTSSLLECVRWEQDVAGAAEANAEKERLSSSGDGCSDTTLTKTGCDVCRSKKVKCDEKQPTCARCNRLKLTCSWPRLELTLQAKRRGYGSLKSRERHNYVRKDAEEREKEKDIWSPRPILPALTNTSGIERNRADSTAPTFPSTTSLTINSSLESDDWLETAGVENDNFTWEVSSNCAENLLPLNALPPNFEELEQFLSAINTGVSWSPGMGSAFPHSLSDHHLPLANSMVLSLEEHNALGHYQTTFSIYRTTKDPKWSTHKLLLDLGSQNTMIMHFILAVSINDVCHRHENHPGSQEAQLHFQAGAVELIETIKNPEANYKFLMAAFLFLYLYMPKRKSVSRHRIKDLSKTVLQYVKRHRLDAQCLDSDDSLDNSSLLTDRERSVLARLIIWTYDEDVKCGFQGSGGHLAGYLTSHRERTMAVYEVSRTALGAHWGSQYPDAQIADDDDNAMELEMLWALTTLWQDINDLSQGLIPDGVDIHRRIKLRFNLLEKVGMLVLAKDFTNTL